MLKIVKKKITQMYIIIVVINVNTTTTTTTEYLNSIYVFC